jgi:regulator of sigma E protease
MSAFTATTAAASTPDLQKLETMSAAEKKISFFHQPVRNRAAIVAAGPIANFILAVVIFGGVLYGIGRNTSRRRCLRSIRANGSPAQAAGLAGRRSRHQHRWQTDRRLRGRAP